jgi:4-hydroxy-2-oxoheptanedioate aldolase
MRRSKILAKIRAGQRAKLAMMGNYLPPFIAYAAHLGFDGIWLDLEHRAFNPREVQALLAFFHLYDIDCLIRPATREKILLYRYLEDGVTGLVIPHVSNAVEARDLVSSVKFPPVGDRGLYPTGLETNFGLSGTEHTLIEHAQRETFLVAQVESPTAVANLDETAAVPGLDGLFVGPGDLGLRRRFQAPDEQLTYSQALDRVADACRKHGKFWGSLPRSVEELQDLHQRGAELLVWGIDIVFLHQGLARTSADLDRILGVG